MAILRPSTCCRTTIAVVSGILLSACDEGKGIYDEAVTLEEAGQLPQAVEKYDAVCRRAPDSKMCDPSVVRAAALRIKLAEQLLQQLKFKEAEGYLKNVAGGDDDKTRKKAEELLASQDLTQGLLWEKAVAMADKSHAMGDIEVIAESGASVAEVAKKWLAKERPALLLAEAEAACKPNITKLCSGKCTRLVQLHPGTPQAAKAMQMGEMAREAEAKAKVEAEATEAKRLYPLLVEAEKLIAQAQRYWQRDQAHDRCVLGSLAGNPDPLVAIAQCGDATSHTRDSDKLREKWELLLEEIRDRDKVDVLKKRFNDAEEHGEYQKQTLQKPGPLPNEADAKNRANE